MPPVNTTELLLTMDGSPAMNPSMLQNAVLVVAAIALGYFLFVMPANKERKEKEALMAALSRDDRVVTTSGMRGRITDVSEDTVTLDMGNKVLIEFEKSAIARRIDDAAA